MPVTTVLAVALIGCVGSVHLPSTAKQKNENAEVIDHNHLYQIVDTYAESVVGNDGEPYRGDGISVSSSGDVFVSSGEADGGRVVKISSDGIVSDFAINLNSANGSAFDSNGNLFVASYRSNAIFKIASDGTKTEFAADLDGPAGLWH